MKTALLAALLLLLPGGLRAPKVLELKPSQGETYLMVFYFLIRLNSYLHLTNQCYSGVFTSCFKMYFNNFVFYDATLKALN